MQLPFKVWDLDISGPIPGKHNENKYIITAIDFATQWPVAQAVKTHTVSQVINSYQPCLSKSPNYEAQTLASRGPPARRASCPQFFGLESEQDLTLENTFELDKLNVQTTILSTLGVPVKTANQQAGPATDSKVTWARTEGETENFPIERGLPRGGQSHNLTREFELPQFKAANEITPATDATKDWEDLVIRKTWANKIWESFTMTDGHTYTLGRQEDAHCHSCNKVTCTFGSTKSYHTCY
ncbi:hypothetical protein DSO57_1019261 [Entomophthora muscae]|uniref:Uncharacterized protein n=1 Tax=Entomophthora muscae TaxID=34485 RepID=A0ACC2UQQ1_9FUNG|nr:hypothetical protein DSO57_1019261 [Entomophthora muscae]